MNFCITAIAYPIITSFSHKITNFKNNNFDLKSWLYFLKSKVLVLKLQIWQQSSSGAAIMFGIFTRFTWRKWEWGIKIPVNEHEGEV